MIKIRHAGLNIYNFKIINVFEKKLKFKIKNRAIEGGDLIDKIMEYKSAEFGLKLSDTKGALLELLYLKILIKKKK